MRSQKYVHKVAGASLVSPVPDPGLAWTFRCRHSTSFYVLREAEIEHTTVRVVKTICPDISIHPIQINPTNRSYHVCTRTQCHQESSLSWNWKPKPILSLSTTAAPDRSSHRRAGRRSRCSWVRLPILLMRRRASGTPVPTPTLSFRTSTPSWTIALQLRHLDQPKQRPRLRATSQDPTRIYENVRRVKCAGAPWRRRRQGRRSGEERVYVADALLPVASGLCSCGAR